MRPRKLVEGLTFAMLAAWVLSTQGTGRSPELCTNTRRIASDIGHARQRVVETYYHAISRRAKALTPGLGKMTAAPASATMCSGRALSLAKGTLVITRAAVLHLQSANWSV